PFLALEHVAGGSLAEGLNGRAWPERDAAELIETLARAIQHAHERGIIHRDLKPANILIADCMSDQSVPKVTDFGLAKVTDQDGPTKTEAFLGTPNYMPPEQAAGNAKQLGAAADIYSLGAILYELITG